MVGPKEAAEKKWLPLQSPQEVKAWIMRECHIKFPKVVVVPEEPTLPQMAVLAQRVLGLHNQ